MPPDSRANAPVIEHVALWRRVMHFSHTATAQTCLLTMGLRSSFNLAVANEMKNQSQPPTSMAWS
jgi:hypothetical protein